MGSTKVDRERGREGGRGRSAYCLASFVALNEVFGFGSALYLPLGITSVSLAVALH